MDPVEVSMGFGDGLNAPQREAVLYEGGPLVVFAGAGSGKTRVITHRVGHLISETGIAPWNVLAVTFTNKAAAEMRERLERMLGSAPARDLWVGTFHATCARLLRRYAAEVGVRRDFVIYDDSDQRAMVTRVIRDAGLDDKRYPPKLVQSRINKAKQEVVGPDRLVVADFVDEHVQKLYATYEQRMQAAGALDFGDLLYRLVVALESNEALRVELARRFRHLLVDEFQDTNHVQYRLVRAIAAQHRQVTVVGDDDQSIYRWRGADRRNILDFRKEFPDAHVVKLEQNYRSTQRILRAAHSIIAHNLDREPKKLWTENEEGAKITVLACADEHQEAGLIVEAIKGLRAAGRSLSEIALFYRIHAQSRVFEEELRRANVPYRVVGGMRFYDRAEIKDMLAYLRVIQNPDDDVSLLRILNVPARGIGKKSIEGLLDGAAAQGIGVYRTIERQSAGASAPAKKLRAFFDTIETLRAKREDGSLNLPALAFAVYADSGYEAWLREQDNAEADARRQNVEELLGSIQELAEMQPDLDLQGFLEIVTLQTDTPEGDAEKSQDKLTLMTVHAAKGLEFPVVAVAGLEEGMFPFERADEEGDPIEQLEEERRLAYVAITRARERLLLTYAQSRRIFGRLRPGRPSPFLRELPADDLHRVGAPRPAASPRPEIRAPRSIDRYDRPRERSMSNDSYVDRSDGDLGAAIRVGMRVTHRKFGRGRVVALKPTMPPRVDVEFENIDGAREVKTIQVDFLQPA